MPGLKSAILSGRLEQKMLVWVDRLEIGDPVVIELNCLEEIDDHVATSQTDPMRRTQGRNRIARDDASAVTILPAKNAILSRRQRDGVADRSPPRRDCRAATRLPECEEGHL